MFLWFVAFPVWEQVPYCDCPLSPCFKRLFPHDFTHACSNAPFLGKSFGAAVAFPLLRAAPNPCVTSFSPVCRKRFRPFFAFLPNKVCSLKNPYSFGWESVCSSAVFACRFSNDSDRRIAKNNANGNSAMLTPNVIQTLSVKPAIR